MIRMRETIMLAAVFSFVGVLSVLAQGFNVDWYTIDGGGEMATAGGNFELSGTIGQSDARNHPEPMTGGSYSLTGGFWVRPECLAVPCDFDQDCDVDQGDLNELIDCGTGPDVPLTPGCEVKDFDGDLDVDQSDFGIFQRCYSGEDNPGDPTCAD